jgi:hypothetical protein
MPRNPDPFRIYRLAGSFKSGKSADCIIATNAGPDSGQCGYSDRWQILAPPPFALLCPKEALEREIVEMRPQIAELKAEAARADS